MFPGQEMDEETGFKDPKEEEAATADKPEAAKGEELEPEAAKGDKAKVAKGEELEPEAGKGDKPKAAKGDEEESGKGDAVKPEATKGEEGKPGKGEEPGLKLGDGGSGPGDEDNNDRGVGKVGSWSGAAADAGVKNAEKGDEGGPGARAKLGETLPEEKAKKVR